MDKNLSGTRLDNPAKRNLELALPIHHSPADWDYQPARGFHLSALQKISSPTALCRPVDGTQGTLGWVFLKELISGNLSEGRITTHFRINPLVDKFWRIYFRTQAKPTTDSPLNSYFIFYTSTGDSVWKRVNGVDTNLFAGTPHTSWAADTWYQIRLTWYLWLTETLEPILRILFDLWEAGAWTNLINFDIANPLWQDTPTNLIGFKNPGDAAAKRFWIDDTVIYRRSA